MLDDSRMLVKIGDTDFVAKEVKYHHSCRKQYLNAAAREAPASDVDTSEYQKLRQGHSKAFEFIADYVQTLVIDCKQPELLVAIHNRYVTIITDMDVGSETYTSYTLGEKLLKHFKGTLSMTKLSKKQGNIVYSSQMQKADVIKENFQHSMSPEAKVADVALLLRNVILVLRNNCQLLPNPLTVESLTKGQAAPPDILLDFFRVLYTGDSTKRSTSERAERYAKSSAADAIFATTRGVVKPGKHLCLGLGLKSITGSRKVIDLVNHFGHSVSYHIVESLETDLALSTQEKCCVTPEGIIQQSGLSTGLAWDNYDENTETLSGSGSLHDTVGICYQNIPTDVREPETEDDVEVDFPTLRKSSKRKRTFEPNETYIKPYRKKPHASTFDYQIRETANKPENLQQIQRRDLAWMISCALLKNTPMWLGWNSLLTIDHLPCQTISYMENISLSPTRLDVVAETLKISQDVASECGEQFALVHYDLAIAKPALQIQAEESPKFDNVFVAFGPFHIQMSYFAAVGYILEESGGPQVLCDTDVIAAGSLSGFLSGKHYNRCKRLHPLLATALRILHFRAFVSQALDIHLGSVLEGLQKVLDDPSADAIQTIECSEEFILLMTQYEKFTEDTRSGKHGSTSQYWMVYIDLVELFLLFSRACHTNDLNLFVFCLNKMCPVFFAANRQNYARWMVRYHLNLLNIDATHPGVRQMLENGGLSIRRTPKPFSRTPVDMTLEQTINVDAASRLTGISAFTSSIAARKRWMITRAMRSAIVGELLSMAGMKCQDYVSQEVKPHRIKRDNDDIQKLICGIEGTLNPFDKTVSDSNLYNISTGRAVSEPVKDDLLGCLIQGQKWCDEFTNGCFADPKRFEKPIKRRKIRNFSTDAVKVKLTGKDMAIRELQGTRDLFGRLLHLAVSRDLDLSIVFSYPLTPVPMTLAHVDGSMNKTDKSKLLNKLESEIQSTSPNNVDACIIDAMFLIRTLTTPAPSTFGGIAKVILKLVCTHAARVDFVCDTYISPSIKDLERAKRGESEAEFNISGPDQKRPKDFAGALNSSRFKTALLKFLACEWGRSCYSCILAGHQVYFGFEDWCYRFEVNNGIVVRSTIPELACQHEEADTRIIWHLQSTSSMQNDATITVRSCDTDVFILLLYHATQMESTIWMDVGLSSNNTRRYIDISSLASHLGAPLCRALPALHAFTGCDYTAAFMRKGKLRPLDIMRKSQVFLEAFGAIGESDSVLPRVVTTIESFVCTLYGKPNLSDVNVTRLVMFTQISAPRTQAHPLDKIKRIEPVLLPPCKAVLLGKVHRANFVSHMWKRAHTSVPVTSPPESNGWTLREGQYEIEWYTSDQLPQNICQHVDDCMPREEDGDEPVYCSSSDESDVE